MRKVNATDDPLMGRFHAADDKRRRVVYEPPDDYDGWLNADSDGTQGRICEMSKKK